MDRVLLLNQCYEPISVISWQKAISLMVLEKVEIIREYNKELHSAHHIIKMPAVIRLFKAFKRPRKQVKFNKTNVLARDNLRCQYCNRQLPPSKLTYDHVVPKSRGGKTTWQNIVCCCEECNRKKGNLLPHEAGLKLNKKPTQPDWIPVFSVALSGENIPEIWKDFCYLS